MKKRSAGNSFINGALWLTVSTIILKIIGLIYKIPLSHLIGDEGMGYFNSAYTVYTFFYILGSAGIPKAISILTSKNEAENIFSSYSLFKLCFKTFSVFGIILFFIFILFAPKISVIAGTETSLPAMYAVAPSIFFICASGAARGYLSGIMKLSHIAISEIISGVIKLILGIAFAYFAVANHFTLPIICAYSISGISIGAFFSFLYLCIASRQKSSIEHNKLPNKEILMQVFKISIPITFASALGSIGSILDLSLIMNGLRETGYAYTVATSLYGNYTTLALPMFTTVGSLIAPISTAMLPFFAKSFSRNDLKDYSANIDLALSLTSTITTPAFFVFLIFSEELLALLFEKGSVKLGFAFLAALAPSVLLLGFLTVINTALEATGKVGVPVISLISGNILKIALSAVLIRNNNIGLLAIPIGAFLSYLLSLLISMIFIKHGKGIKISLIKSTAKSFFISALSVFPLIIFKSCGFWYAENRSFSFLFFVIYVILYVLISILLNKKARVGLLNISKINKKID